MPTSSQRHNRKHQPKPALYAQGKAIYECRRADPALLTDSDLLALEYHLSHMVMLPRGGRKLKFAVAAEKKKRGL